jgi:hypothetical protein
MIRIRDERRTAELALGFGGLGGEDMAHLRLATLELAGAGLMKALGCAAVGLQLWHGVPDENCVLDNLLSIYDFVGGALEFDRFGYLLGKCQFLTSYLLTKWGTEMRNANIGIFIA